MRGVAPQAQSAYRAHRAVLPRYSSASRHRAVLPRYSSASRHRAVPPRYFGAVEPLHGPLGPRRASPIRLPCVPCRSQYAEGQSHDQYTQDHAPWLVTHF